MTRPHRAGDLTQMCIEASQASDVVARQMVANAPAVERLVHALRANPPRGILTCARGSSDHAATFGRYLFELELGLLTASASPSIPSVYGVSPDWSGMLAIGISQSGKSPDLVATMRAARETGAHTLALVNDADARLARECDTCLPLHAGPEASVAATKSCIASLSALVNLVACWSCSSELLSALADMPRLLREAWQCDWSPLVERLVGANSVYVIGRGLGLGIAQEAALKLKETCGLHAEALSAAELRHGPMALAGPGFPMLVFRQNDATAQGIDELVAEVVASGGDVLLCGGNVKGAVNLPVPAAHPAIEPVLQLQAFYRAASSLALRRGFDPDRPPRLSKVTQTR